jgi:high-affinity Fe2+/Pb2+ permease
MAEIIKTDSPKDDARKSLKQKVVDFVNDTATLDVITLTGTIALVTDQDEPSETNKDKEEFNWENIFDRVAAGMKNAEDNKVSIVAYTHAEWDQDSVNYVAKDADTKLVEAHGKIVAAAHESRINAVKSVVEAVEKLFD